MKGKTLLIILLLFIQNLLGQACGIYRIKYTLSFETNNIKIEKVKFPTIQFLHGKKDYNLESTFIETIYESSKLELIAYSHLTSTLYDKAESLYDFYKTRQENIPIYLIVNDKGIRKKIRIEINWSDVKITKIKDSNFGNLFLVDLKKVKINN